MEIDKGKWHILIGAIATLVIGLLYAFSMGLVSIPFLNIKNIRMVPVTPFDIMFLIVFSLMAGAVIALHFYKSDKIKSGELKETCAISGGVILGFLTSVCPFCPILIFLLFGVSVTLMFLSPYFTAFRILSLVLLGLSLYWLVNSIRKPRRHKK